MDIYPGSLALLAGDALNVCEIAEIALDKFDPSIGQLGSSNGHPPEKSQVPIVFQLLNPFHNHEALFHPLKM